MNRVRQRKITSAVFLYITLALAVTGSAHAQTFENFLNNILGGGGQPPPARQQLPPPTYPAPGYWPHSPPASSPPAYPKTSPPLPYNQNHADIQAGLNRLGYDAGIVDGKFGDRTRRAMNAFQQDNGLPVTTAVNSTTLQAIRLAVAADAELAPNDIGRKVLPPAPLPVANGNTPPVSPDGSPAILRNPPDGIRPFDLTEWNGLAMITSSRDLSALIELLQMRQYPEHLDQNECAVFHTFLTEAAVRRFSGSTGCNPGVIWKGDDEFARNDTRNLFYQQQFPHLLAMVSGVPNKIVLSDDIRLGEFNSKNMTFPLVSMTRNLEQVFASSPGQNLNYNLSSGKRRNAGFPKLSPVSPLPEMLLPTASPQTARELITTVNSWTYRQGGLPKTGQRMVRRQAVIEFLGYHPATRRLDVRLHSLALYDLELRQKIHEFPLPNSALPVIVAGMPEKLVVPSPAPMDQIYLALLHVAAAGENTPETVWDDLVASVADRDSAYHAAQARNPGSGYPENDARRPFFANGDYRLASQSKALFRKWAIAYAAALPELAELRQNYGNSSLQSGQTYKFSPFKGGGVAPEYANGLQETGLQQDQITGISIQGRTGVSLALANLVRFYDVEVAGDALAPYNGIQLSLRTLLRVDQDTRYLDPEHRKQLLARATPVSFRILSRDQEIMSHSYDDIPALGDSFTVEPPATKAHENFFDRPQRLSDEAINLLLAGTLDPTHPLYGGLVAQRWEIEQTADILTPRLFAKGKRKPTPEESRELAGDLSTWAKGKIPPLPAELVLTTPFDRPEDSGPDALAWSSLSCVSAALSQNERIRIAANTRNRNADLARKQMAMNGNASWKQEDDWRIAALEREPRLAHLVSLLGCGDVTTRTRNPLPVYLVNSSALPPGPDKAASADVRLRISRIDLTDQQPDYLALLPEKMRSYMVSGYQPGPPQDGVRIDSDLVEVVFRDASGQQLASVKPEPSLILENIIAGFEAATTPPAAGENGMLPGYDIIGIRTGMSFDEAEGIIRTHMEVGRVLDGSRLSDGSMDRGNIRPATSGKLFISKDGMEYIALLDEPPGAAGKVLAAWRRIYLTPNQMSSEEVITNLQSKYGKPARPVSEGLRNYWSTPAGYDCFTTYVYGGQRPALSARWYENGQPAALALPDGRPVPDAMLPQAVNEPLNPANNQHQDCGPAFTAEFSLDASRAHNSGHPAGGRDWIEQIITDIRPYIDAYQANRAAIQASGSSGGPGTPQPPAIRF